MSKHNSVLEQYPAYECVIGIEVHVQLNTATKIFCTCANAIVNEPNQNICQICTGYPGVLPVLNKRVVSDAILAGLATNSRISPLSEFARKHYFYPDLPKSYQITQNDKPICTEGYISIIDEEGKLKNVRLMRIHIEEDAGKNIHSSMSNESFVDLNRAGTPLLEMVSHPDIASAFEARAYLKALRLIVQYVGICSGNMEEGAFRADTNISVRKKGATLGTRVELKNINSFKFISDAIEYEIERQIELLEEGGSVKQETRLWDTKTHKTIVMRSKEEAADYRYFPDPDLPLIVINDSDIDVVKRSMPELPLQKFERFCAQGLSPYEAEILVDDLELANYFDAARKHSSSKSLINWVLRDIMALLKDHKVSLADCKVTPEKLAQLVDLLEKDAINNRVAQEIFAIVAQTGHMPVDIMREKGLEQIGVTDELESIIKTIVAQYPEQVAEYKAGRERVFGFFVGEAMKQTKGKGNPKIIQELLKKYMK
jgi:aspartyl-tRNA(Asn)/glutamyl-tRNA(Gln) amidotransferase subunit B